MLVNRCVVVAILFTVACLADIEPSIGNNTRLRVLRGGEHGVGELVSNHTIKSLDGQKDGLRDLAGRNQAVVVAMTSTSCPISKKYFPTLLALSDEYAAQNVEFILVNSTPNDTPRSLDQAQQRLSGTARYVVDKSSALAAALGTTSTTDAILIDHDGTIVYHGAVDDQFGPGVSRPKPNHRFLADAIGALLADSKPRIEATTAPGSELASKTRSGPRKNNVTYHNRISRLMNRHCVKCHRDGGVGPFGLDTMDGVTSHAPMIGEVVKRGTMPAMVCRRS